MLGFRVLGTEIYIQIYIEVLGFRVSGIEIYIQIQKMILGFRVLGIEIYLQVYIEVMQSFIGYTWEFEGRKAFHRFMWLI